MPAWVRLANISGSRLAGPIVQTILVRSMTRPPAGNESG
jgi:hypothetical protein